MDPSLLDPGIHRQYCIAEDERVTNKALGVWGQTSCKLPQNLAWTKKKEFRTIIFIWCQMSTVVNYKLVPPFTFKTASPGEKLPFSPQTAPWGPKRPGKRSMRTATSDTSEMSIATSIFVGRATCSAWLMSQTARPLAHYCIFLVCESKHRVLARQHAIQELLETWRIAIQRAHRALHRALGGLDQCPLRHPQQLQLHLQFLQFLQLLRCGKGQRHQWAAPFGVSSMTLILRKTILWMNPFCWQRSKLSKHCFHV